MGELESIRDIARRLVAEYRLKRTTPTVQESAWGSPVNEKIARVAVATEPVFEGMDREWLRQLGIEA
jgi:hypothetical protein